MARFPRFTTFPPLAPDPVAPEDIANLGTVTSAVAVSEAAPRWVTREGHLWIDETSRPILFALLT